MIKLKNQMIGGKIIRAKVRGAIDMGLKKWRRFAPSSDAAITPMRMKYLILRFGFGSFDSFFFGFLKKIKLLISIRVPKGQMYPQKKRPIIRVRISNSTASSIGTIIALDPIMLTKATSGSSCRKILTGIILAKGYTVKRKSRIKSANVIP